MSPCEALTMAVILTVCIAAFIWAQAPSTPEPFDGEDEE